MTRDEILEYTGADEWSWIQDAFGGLSVADIEAGMYENFDWGDTHDLAVAIYNELGPIKELRERLGKTQWIVDCMLHNDVNSGSWGAIATGCKESIEHLRQIDELAYEISEGD